jgi:hypothetical protein
MKILIACEFSGIVRDAFAALGHNAWSCDLLPSETPGQHHQGPLEDFIGSGRDWDFIGGHPPCTFMANSGVRWLYGDHKMMTGEKSMERWRSMESACAFFNMIRNRDCPHIYIENPIMHKHARRLIHCPMEHWEIVNEDDPTQIIQPWQFGHGETKATCLWLKGLPPLQPTNIVAGRNSRVHFESPSPDRWKERSRTLPGIAAAMARQWGGVVDLSADGPGNQTLADYLSSRDNRLIK